MVCQREAEFRGNFMLPLFDFGIDKFLNPATLQAQNMIMMIALIQLENRLPAFEMVSFDQAGRFKLRQHPVNRRQADFLASTQ